MTRFSPSFLCFLGCLFVYQTYLVGSFVQGFLQPTSNTKTSALERMQLFKQGIKNSSNIQKIHEKTCNCILCQSTIKQNHHDKLCACPACNSADNLVRKAVNRDLGHRASPKSMLTHPASCSCPVCAFSSEVGLQAKLQKQNMRSNSVSPAYASSHDSEEDTVKPRGKPLAPRPEKVLSGQTIFNPNKGQGTQKVFWDHLGQHVELPDWSPEDKKVGVIYDIVNDDIHDRLEEVYEIFGNQIELVSTYDGIFRFKYYGQVRHLLGMQAWCKSEIEKLGTVPEMKELRFETEDQADPFWDYSY